MTRGPSFSVIVLTLTLPAHVRARDKAVQPHSLDTYDQLKKVGHDEP